jgi:hypothetical protein
VSAPVLALTEEVLKAMLISKLKVVAGLGVVVAGIGVGTGAVAWSGGQSIQRGTVAEAYTGLRSQAAPKSESAVQKAAPAQEDFASERGAGVEKTGAEGVARNPLNPVLAAQAPPIAVPPIAPATDSKFYECRYEVTEISPNGGEKRIALPRSTTGAGESARIQIGTPPLRELPGGNEPEDYLAVSTTVTPLADGKLRLDASFTRSDKAVPGKDELKISARTIRLIKVFEPGEVVSVDLDGSDKDKPRIQIRVTTTELVQKLVPSTRNKRSLAPSGPAQPGKQEDR